MHCPSCGQQQISNETKFCSRCGMPLGLVSEVLSHGGYLPQLAELNKKKPSIYTRKNGLAFSLIWALFFVFIATPMLGILRAGNLPGMTAVLGIFGGLILMLCSFMFLKNDRKLPQYPSGFAMPNQPMDLPAGQQSGYALPPQQSIPVSSYGPPQPGNWRDTNDLQPTSVTESTTKLLDKNDR